MKKIISKSLIIFICLFLVFSFNNKQLSIIKAETLNSYDNVYIDDTKLEECSFTELKSVFDTENFIENEIKDSFYFKNFLLEEEYNYIGTCSIVSLSILLCYYDTFYNDNIVKDTITYVNRNGVELTINTMKNGEFDNCLDYQYSNAALGPTKEFHDYLVDLMIRYNIKTLIPKCDLNGNYILNDIGEIEYVISGISQIEMNQIFEKYCLENNVDNNLLIFNNEIYLTGINMLNLLNSDIPLVLSIENYSYFYTQNGKVQGKKVINGSHSVVCYGYIETDNGILLKVHLGYDNDNIIDKDNQFYINIDSVLSYSYYNFDFNNNHICSSNYEYNNKYNSAFKVEICPCHDLNYYFDHSFLTDSNNELIHKFVYKNNCDFSVEGKHELIYENNQMVSHSIKCVYFEYCNFIEVIYHNFNSECEQYSYDISEGHYYKCDDCKTTRLFDHTFDVESFNNEKHRLICVPCVKRVLETHTSVFNGNIYNHYRYCDVCNDIFEEEHTLLYNEYNTISHQIVCSCGFVDYENHEYNDDYICMKCNYIHSEHYFYDYDKINNSFHYKKCLCGYMVSEMHSFKDYLGSSKCLYCGFITSGNVLLKIENDYTYTINHNNTQTNNLKIDFYQLKKEEEFL